MKTLISAVAATVILGVTCTATQAAYPESANVSKFGVAIVDIGYIFDQHKSFTAAMEGMKKEMKQIEDSLKTKRDAIATQEKGLVEMAKTIATTSPQYKAADDRLARAKADFNLEMNKLRKDLMQRESRIYFQTYKQVKSAVARYAQQKNIGMVLRFNGNEPNPEVRPDIIKAINNPLWYYDNIDITREILDIVNGGPTAPVASGRTGTKVQ